MIKAIETRYKGYRFRSRLEARWAVFFDRLGLRWEYEPEGYELPSGRYLPDFFIRSDVDGVPRIDFVEIKGAASNALDVALAHELAKHLSCCGHILQGDPVVLCAQSFYPHFPHGEALPADVRAVAFMAWTWTGFSREFSEEEIASALVAARSARFEHGESGA